MLQTRLQQAKNGDDQRPKMLLNLGNRTKETINKYRLSVNLPFPHFKPAKLTTDRHWNWMRQLTNFGMFYGELGNESGQKKRIFPTIKNDGERDQKDRIMPILSALHNAALRGECRINQPSAHHFHHQNQPHTQNATRHESRLNALLCLRLKGLSFTIPRA